MQGEQYQRFLNQIRERATVIDDVIQTIYIDCLQEVNGVPAEVMITNDEFYLLAEESDKLLDLICQMKNFVYDMEMEAEKILGNREEIDYDI